MAVSWTTAYVQVVPPKPAPDWVLVTVNGEQGWVPPSHPLAQRVPEPASQVLQTAPECFDP